MTTERPLRVLVVDDSALNRDETVSALNSCANTEVAGTATNGSEALRLAQRLKPDVITLDLEMPKLDGFSFLRIVPGIWPCPVIVISGRSGDKTVFRALELGAIDFIEKPDTSSKRRSALPAILDEKLRMIRALKPAARTRRPPAPTVRQTPPTPMKVSEGGAPRHFLALAASTGGPTAVTEILSNLDGRLRCAVLVAQHMPDRFTRTFAERLNRHSQFSVSEACSKMPIVAGTALVCPGRRCLEVVRENGRYHAEILAPLSSDRYVPSADRLFSSLARAAGRQVIGVVLTGMGDDGTEGARVVVERGGTVLAESEDTAIVYGMPRAVTHAGLTRRSLALHDIAGYLNDLMRG